MTLSAPSRYRHTIHQPYVHITQYVCNFQVFSFEGLYFDMINSYYKGENVLIKWSLVDKTGAPVLFTSLSEVTVVLTDIAGKTQTFTKTGGLITVGDTTNMIKFEMTEAMSSAFAVGKIKARFTYKITNANYASGFLTDVIEEGVQSDFITITA